MPLPHLSPMSSRRSFLTVAAGVAVGASAAPVLVPVERLRPRAAAQQLDGAGFAAFGESLELAVVEAYDGIVDLLSSDLAAVADTFVDHHREHAEAFAELAGDRATGQANGPLLEALAPQIEELGTQSAALALARTTENQIVATYAWALSQLADDAAASLVATILPAESAHAATLGHILGEGIEGAFPFGAFESADIANGLDPNVFPAG